MKIKKLLKLLMLLLLGFVIGSSTIWSPMQQGGIEFKHLSLDEAKIEAQKLKKLIFIDAYTSWCGPCKKMAATSFKNENVGNLFNDKFINLKIDCERDADGPEISRMYKISAYPTLLFIDSSGKLRKMIVGFQTEQDLLTIGNSVK